MIPRRRCRGASFISWQRMKQTIPRSHFRAAWEICGDSLRFSPRRDATTSRITAFSLFGTASHQSGTSGRAPFVTVVLFVPFSL